MGSINKTVRNVPNAVTHEGAPVVAADGLEQLKRLVMTCMLWEDSFYINGQDHADLLKTTAESLIESGKAAEVYEVARAAKHEQHIRHAPLLLGRLLAAHGAITADQIDSLINRVDDIPEFLTMYWGGSHRTQSGQKLSHPVRRGLAKAFRKFSEYSIAKYRMKGRGVSLKDALRILRVKPLNDSQAELYRKIVSGELKAPDTWEVALSGGADKKETFERLMREKNLGALATLRNLRNMLQAQVDSELLGEYLGSMNTEKILPFHFVKAYEFAPQFVNQLNTGMMKALESRRDTLKGKTIVLLDKSGSMTSPLSGKSELTRSDAAKGLAILLGEVCENVRLYQFDTQAKLVEGKCENGLALLKNLARPDGGTDIEAAIKQAIKQEAGEYDRLIILTDEQSRVRASGLGLGKKSYILSVAHYQNGVGYEFACTHINGWSDQVVDYIVALESV